MLRTRFAFTLIELLIVVAIIAILAAIAVPNLLEAQVRAKVSRCRADQRTVGTAFEAYCVDNKTYPPLGTPPIAPYTSWSGWWLDGCYFVTTPIAYLTSAKVTRDPFKKPGQWPSTDIYETNSYLHYDASRLHPILAEKSVRYIIVSFGPAALLQDGDPHFGFAHYDPTNGTTSIGMIVNYGPGGYSVFRF